MSVDGVCASSVMETTVVVAVKGGDGGRGGRASRRAVHWAAENLMPVASRFVLVHVMPAISSIPTPSGNSIPIGNLDANVVRMYVDEKKLMFEEVFTPFKKLCKSNKIETLVLEGPNPASAILEYVADAGATSIVLGSCTLTSSFLTRTIKGDSVPSIVLKNAPESCNIYVVSRREVITKSDEPSVANENVSRKWLFSQRGRGYHRTTKSCSVIDSPLGEYKPDEGIRASSTSFLRHMESRGSAQAGHSNHILPLRERNHRDMGSTDLEFQTVQESPSVASEVADQGEVEQLRLEFANTISMYHRACEDLVVVQDKVRLLSLECLEEARQVNAAARREEVYRKITTQEKERHLKAVKKVERARNVLSEEAYGRQTAELRARKESMDKQKHFDELFSNDRRYKGYSKDEIEKGTDFFSVNKMIGEGAYGKVYRCYLNNTQVAVKVLQPDESDKREEFLREVEVLSQLHHPHIVLLLGACPGIGCLVYEYMENGSLEDHILKKHGVEPLPWSVRFRIAFQVACGLAFLHNSKPEAIVHRDLKPGNILLDRNYTSKIGDVGLAKLVSDVVPDNITEYRDSILAGTVYYMDPEYQRTGTIRPKSDLYAFGIIILQLLAAQQPKGLVSKVENAIMKGSFSEILDKSIPDWPVAEAEELARLALKCSRLRCRDRPDLETEVLPVLKKLVDVADGTVLVEGSLIDAPSQFFCPILQEVMDDPHILSDGFTYERHAINAWLERQNVSPVTKLLLQHKVLIPNHALRLAIQEWRLRVESKPGKCL